MPSDVVKLQYSSPSTSMADDETLCPGRTGGAGAAFPVELILFIGENTSDALNKILKNHLLVENRIPVVQWCRRFWPDKISHKRNSKYNYILIVAALVL